MGEKLKQNTAPIIKRSARGRVTKSSVALKAFFNIAQKWTLSVEQQAILLGTPKSTVYRWRQGGGEPLSPDTLERISYVLGIYKALRILLPNKNAADTWIKRPNSAPLFGGHTALEKLMKGRVVDLADVRRYLDAERGW